MATTLAVHASTHVDALIARPSPFALPPGRSSSLPAPSLALDGHEGPVYGVSFSRNGAHLASASRDKTVLVWDLHGEGGVTNSSVLRGHKNAVTSVAWDVEGDRVLTSSADGTVGVWDAASGTRVRTLKGHEGIVNDVVGGRSTPGLLASGGDDGFCRVWDMRARGSGCVLVLDGGAPVLAVALGDGTPQPCVWAAGVDPVIKSWGLVDGAPGERLPGHTDTVTGLALSPDGMHLASFGMDGVVRAWDVRPFSAVAGVSGSRCVRALPGAANNFEQHLLRPAWSGAGDRLAVGSAVTRSVFVWGWATGELEGCIPGHASAPLGVSWSPTEPVLASGGADKRVFLHELPQVVGR